MAISNQEVRVYVSKVETNTGEMLVVNSSFNKFGHFGIGGVPISTEMGDEKFIETIKNYMIKFFVGIIPCLEKFSVKLNIKYLFNQEYSADGQLLYYNDDNGNNKNAKHFHAMYWVDLKKPLTSREIELFVKALRQIPDF